MEPKISGFDAASVARIARIEMVENEISKIEKDLNDIIKAFSDLDEIKTDCKPSFQPVEIKNVTRKDELEESLLFEDVFSNTEHKKDNFFKGPKVL